MDGTLTLESFTSKLNLFHVVVGSSMPAKNIETKLFNGQASAPISVTWLYEF